MAKAVWNGVVIAESNDTVVVERNHYFPVNAVKMEFFTEAEPTSVCPWKGTANYYDIVVDGETNTGAAWIYRTPKDAAKNIKDHMAFWKGVEVQT